MLQVRDMAAKYPEIKEELAGIESSLEMYAQENAIAPPDAHREKVLNSLLTNFADDSTFTGAKVRQLPERDLDYEDEDIEDNVVPISGGSNFFKYAFVASLALLAVSLVSLYSVYSKLQQSNAQLAVLTTQNQKYSTTVHLMDSQMDVFRDPSYKYVKLQGLPKSPSSSMAVAFSPAKHKVMIDMGNTHLPANDKAHQYQLWALVAGKPVDLGVFDAGADSAGMVEMKPTALADAFAVTLEPRGGSVNPTMSEMMVMGK